ncbi:MAG TPA: hypothetical protein VL551_33690 [Actinospica sp.]|jgi:seryl-tRNA synthetase|nr:hypothetical protein [Actinospica sp.]
MSGQAVQGPRTHGFTVRDGLAVLGPDALRLRGALDDVFTGWALEHAAEPREYPPLLRVEDLARIDYFENFPHLASLVSGLAAPGGSAVDGSVPIPGSQLADSGYALASAACYPVYFDLAGSALPETAALTTVARCFRRETHYDGLRRLMGFTMREAVFIGERAAVLDALTALRSRVTSFAAALGLEVKLEAATDPFFDPAGARAAMQRLFPVKEEVVWDGGLAIASVNFHRNFFGDRCAIVASDGAPAFSGCVAFGLERWIAALGAVHHGDLVQALAAVSAARAHSKGDTC